MHNINEYKQWHARVFAVIGGSARARVEGLRGAVGKRETAFTRCRFTTR